MSLRPLHLRPEVWEEDHVTNRLRTREQHHQAIDADAQPTSRRHAVLERAHVVVVESLCLVVTERLEARLRLEAAALVDRIVELAERVGELAAADDQLEALRERRVAAMRTSERR